MKKQRFLYSLRIVIAVIATLSQNISCQSVVEAAAKQSLAEIKDRVEEVRRQRAAAAEKFQRELEELRQRAALGDLAKQLKDENEQLQKQIRTALETLTHTADVIKKIAREEE